MPHGFRLLLDINLFTTFHKFTRSDIKVSYSIVARLSVRVIRRRRIVSRTFKMRIFIQDVSLLLDTNLLTAFHKSTRSDIKVSYSIVSRLSVRVIRRRRIVSRTFKIGFFIQDGFSFSIQISSLTFYKSIYNDNFNTRYCALAFRNFLISITITLVLTSVLPVLNFPEIIRGFYLHLQQQ